MLCTLHNQVHAAVRLHAHDERKLGVEDERKVARQAEQVLVRWGTCAPRRTASIVPDETRVHQRVRRRVRHRERKHRRVVQPPCALSRAARCRRGCARGLQHERGGGGRNARRGRGSSSCICTTRASVPRNQRSRGIDDARWI